MNRIIEAAEAALAEAGNALTEAQYVHGGTTPETIKVRVALANAAAALRALRDGGAEPAALPKEPPPGLLMSMAIRLDHGLGMPGYYDFGANQLLNVPTHAQRLASAMATARQLYEEVSGNGFYSPEKEAEYAALAATPKEGSPT